MLACVGKAYQPFQYAERGSMATIGRSQAIACFGRLRISGFPAWLARLFAHIVFLIGFRNRVAVIFEWAWMYFTFQRGVRPITGNVE